MSVSDLHDTTRLAPSAPHDPDELVRVPRACELLGGISVATIYRLKNDGLIEMRKLLGTTLVTRQSIDELRKSLPPVPRTKSARAVARGSHPKPRRKLRIAKRAIRRAAK